MWVVLLGFVAGVIVVSLNAIAGLVLFGLAIVVALVLRPGQTFVLPGRVVLLTELLAAGFIGWISADLFWGFAGRRTPPPPAAVSKALAISGDSARLAGLSAAERAAIIDYASHLTFADSADADAPQDRYHGQWDRNLLDTLGSIGVLLPEVHIHRTWKRDLAFGRGRIQLKITIVPAPNHPGTVVNEDGILLHPGLTYVWVDSLVSNGRDKITARALYIPADDRLPVQRRLLHVLRGKRWNQAVARWTPGQCWDCVSSDWCH